MRQTKAAILDIPIYGILYIIKKIERWANPGKQTMRYRSRYLNADRGDRIANNHPYQAVSISRKHFHH